MSAHHKMQSMSPRSFSTDRTLTPPSPYQPTNCPHCDRLRAEKDNIRAGMQDIESQPSAPLARARSRVGVNIFITFFTFLVSYVAGVFFPLVGKSVLHYASTADKLSTPAPPSDPTIPPLNGQAGSQLPDLRPSWWPTTWLAPFYGCIILYAIIVPAFAIIQLLIGRCLRATVTEMYWRTMLGACLPVAGFVMAVGILVVPHDAGADFAGLAAGQVVAAGCMGYVVIGIPLTVLLFLLWLCGKGGGNADVGSECSCAMALCCLGICNA
ncbi:hypothetical protein L226DRAFT_152444 [Lentinus tigrinus ALCF2SS1-7]|uniref:uncharacterized protein n=1 Tax=Lentinus tigrinus ALCF2SS1-7 TaxID=1328758 RepID=UPI0011662082|nr:hypothetical protein L226DRAFT_152444 [Lentinus tigrinus ALCF2SS1-7]